MKYGRSWLRGGRTKRSSAGLAAVAALVVLAVLVPAANAQVVRLTNGRLAGVYLRPGLSTAAYEHRTGARPVTAVRQTGLASADPNGLFWQGGPVLHTTRPYLVYWDPSNAISARSRQVLTQYLIDAGVDSGNPTDVYAYRVLPQYTDSTGPSAQGQTFLAASQAISDGQPYPAVDPTTCTPLNQIGFARCITDTQLQQELTRLINTDHLPSGTGANAPVYFVVTPANVDVCADARDCSGGQNGTFCAYHSDYDLPSTSTPVVYASIPFTLGTACQGARLGTTQEPNGDVADVIADNLSHENAEAITDPLPDPGTTAWVTTNGDEVADQCEEQGPNDPNDPNGPTSMDAYLPTLGGSEGAGTLYDQLINGDHYFTQTLWSNSADNCVATSPSASFTSPGRLLPGVSASFDPSASSSSNGYDSTTWNWGDGQSTSTVGSPTPTSHTFTSPGTYTVTLTLVDGAGNTSQVSHAVVVDSPPTAAFSASAGVAETGSPVAFNGATSSDPNPGGSITGYSWSFGDGSPGAAGVAPSHAYGSPGTYNVTLTVAGSDGLTATVSHAVTIVAVPVAVPSRTTRKAVAGSPVSFSGRASSGGITTYAWNFGDGATGSGVAPKHIYARRGTYTVTLTVADAAGFTSTRSLSVAVHASPIKSASLKLVKGKYYLIVTVRGPGTVRVGSAKVTLKRAGKATLKLSLSGAQRRRLHRHKTVKLTIIYTPRHGARITEVTTVKLKR